MKYFKARTGTSPPGPLIHSISSRFSGLVLEALPGAMMCTGGWRPLVQIEPDIKWSMRIESEQAFLSNLYQPFKSNNGWTKRSFAKNTVYWWASYCKLCVPLNMVWYYIRTWFIRRQNPSSSGVTPFDKLLSFFYVSEIWDDPSPGNHYETIDSNSPYVQNYRLLYRQRAKPKSRSTEAFPQTVPWNLRPPTSSDRTSD